MSEEPLHLGLKFIYLMKFHAKPFYRQPMEKIPIFYPQQIYGMMKRENLPNVKLLANLLLRPFLWILKFTEQIHPKYKKP
ncbi:MAG: hypothetical protein ACTSRK_00885 [Promethearchaeota archaeon]